MTDFVIRGVEDTQNQAGEPRWIIWFDAQVGPNQWASPFYDARDCDAFEDQVSLRRGVDYHFSHMGGITTSDEEVVVWMKLRFKSIDSDKI